MAVPHSRNSALANMASIFGAVTNVAAVHYFGKSDGKEPRYDTAYSTSDIPNGKVLIELIESGGVPDYSITSTTDYPVDIDVRLIYPDKPTKAGSRGTTEAEARTIEEALWDALRADPQLADGGTDTCANTTITNIQPPFTISKALAMRMFTVRVEIRRDS